MSICLHYGQSNDLIENATGLRGCGGEKLTRHHYILFLFRLCLHFTNILQHNSNTYNNLVMHKHKKLKVGFHYLLQTLHYPEISLNVI